MDLSVAIQIFAILALITFIILAVYVMVSLNTFIKQMRDTSRDLKVSVDKIITELSEIKTKAIATMYVVDKTAEEVIIISNDVQSKADRIFSILQPLEVLAKDVYDRIAPPLTQVSFVVSAASKALSVFTNKIFKK